MRPSALRLRSSRITNTLTLIKRYNTTRSSNTTANNTNTRPSPNTNTTTTTHPHQPLPYIDQNPPTQSIWNQFIHLTRLARNSTKFDPSSQNRKNNKFLTPSVMGLSGSIFATRYLLSNNALALWEDPNNPSPGVVPSADLFPKDFNDLMSRIPKKDDPEMNIEDDDNFADFHQQEGAKVSNLSTDFDTYLKQPKPLTPKQESRQFTDEATDAAAREEIRRGTTKVSEADAMRQMAILKKLTDSNGKLSLEDAQRQVDRDIERERKRRDPNYKTQADFDSALIKKAQEMIESTEKPLLPSELRALFPSQYDQWLQPVDEDGNIIDPSTGEKRIRSQVLDESDFHFDQRLLDEIEHWFKLNTPNKNTSQELAKYLLNTPVPEEYLKSKELGMYFQKRDFELEQSQTRVQTLDNNRRVAQLMVESGIFEANKLNLFNHYRPWVYYFIPPEPQHAFEPLLPSLDNFKKLIDKDPLQYTQEDLQMVEEANYYFERWVHILLQKPQLLDMVEAIQLEQQISEGVKEQIAAAKHVFETQIEPLQGENVLGMDPGVFSTFLSGVKKIVVPNQEMEEFSQIKNLDNYKKLKASFQRAVLDYNSIAIVLEELAKTDRDESSLLLKQQRLAHRKMKAASGDFANFMRLEAMKNGIDKKVIHENVQNEFQQILSVAETRLKAQITATREGRLDLILPEEEQQWNGAKSQMRLLLEEYQAARKQGSEERQAQLKELRSDADLAKFHNIKSRDGSSPVLINVDPSLLPGMTFSKKTQNSNQEQKKVEFLIGHGNNVALPQVPVDNIRRLKSDGTLVSPRTDSIFDSLNQNNDQVGDPSASVEQSQVPNTDIVLQRVYNPNTNQYVYYTDSRQDKQLFEAYCADLQVKYNRMAELRQFAVAREHNKYRKQIQAEIQLAKQQQELEIEGKRQDLANKLSEMGYSQIQIEEMIRSEDLGNVVPPKLQEIYQRYHANDDFSLHVQDNTDPRIIASFALELQQLEDMFVPLGKRVFQRYVIAQQKETVLFDQLHPKRTFGRPKGSNPQPNDEQEQTSKMTLAERRKLELTKDEKSLIDAVKRWVSKQVPSSNEFESEFDPITSNSFIVPEEQQLDINVPEPPTDAFQWPVSLEELITSLVLDHQYFHVNPKWSPFTFLSGFNHQNGREEFEIYARTGPAHHLDPKPAPKLGFPGPLSKYFSPQTAMTLFGLIHFGPYCDGLDLPAVEAIDTTLDYERNEITNYSFDPFTPPAPWDDINTRAKFYQKLEDTKESYQHSIDLTREISFDSSDPWENDDFAIQLHNESGIREQYLPTQYDRIKDAMDRPLSQPVSNMLTESLELLSPPKEHNEDTVNLDENKELTTDTPPINTETELSPATDTQAAQNEEETGFRLVQDKSASFTIPTPTKDQYITIRGLDDGMIISTLNKFAHMTIAADNQIGDLTNSHFEMLTYNVLQYQTVPFMCVTNLEYRNDLDTGIDTSDFQSTNNTTNDNNSKYNDNKKSYAQQLFDAFPTKSPIFTPPESFKSLDNILNTMWAGFKQGVEDRTQEEGLVDRDWNPPNKPVEKPTTAIVTTWLFPESLGRQPVAKLTNYYTLSEFISQPRDAQARTAVLTHPALSFMFRTQRQEEQMNKFVMPFIREMFGSNSTTKKPLLSEREQQEEEDRKKFQEESERRREIMHRRRVIQKDIMRHAKKRDHWPSRLKEDLQENNPYMFASPMQALSEYVRDVGLDQPYMIPVEPLQTDSGDNDSNQQEETEELQVNPLFASNESLKDEKTKYDAFILDLNVGAFLEQEAEAYREYRQANPQGYHWPELKNIPDLPFDQLLGKLAHGLPNVLEQARNPKLNSAAHLVNENELWVQRLQRYFAHETKLSKFLPWATPADLESNAYRYGHLTQSDRAAMLLDDSMMLYNAILLITPDKILVEKGMRQFDKDVMQKKARLVDVYSTPDPFHGFFFDDVLKDYDPETNKKKKQQQLRLEGQKQEPKTEPQKDGGGGWFSGVWGWFGG